MTDQTSIGLSTWKIVPPCAADAPLSAFMDRIADRKGFGLLNEPVLREMAHSLSDDAAFGVNTMSIELVRVKLEHLGLQIAHHDEIVAAAEVRGLACLPCSLGPMLRLDYATQPAGEWLYCGMRPVRLADGRRFIFTLDATVDARWLGACNAEAPIPYWAGISFLFRRPCGCLH